MPIKGFFICNRGLFLTVMADHPIWSWVIAAFFLGIALTFFANHFGLKRQAKSGQEFPIIIWGIGLLFLFPVLIWLLGGAPTKLSVPELQGFNFSGGYNLSPEFFSLLLGLVLYTGAFNAEIVRAGIMSVRKGQWEAAESLGLSRFKSLRLVIFPQALRVIIPPFTSQLLNLTKNSFLAVAIAYPDFVNIANTTLNQTGQAVEVVGLIMAVYLTFSLLTSFFMNWFNRKMALVDR